MKLEWERIKLATTRPFTISRWGYEGHENVIVTITDSDGVVGMGEAAPNRYYKESPDSVAGALAKYEPVINRARTWSLEATEAELARTDPGNASARAALSSALHDLHARRLHIPLHRMWGLDAALAPLSSFTIAIDDAEGLRARVAEAAEYPVLKIKIGTDRDEEIVRVVREAAGDKTLRVDANAAWTADVAEEKCAMLREYGVESVEQPVASDDLEGLRHFTAVAGMPVLVDESCLVSRDIPRIAGACTGINLKLAKCGSLREALRMIHTARAHDLTVMAGCMIESSLGISAIAQIAPLLDAADFDGAALLSDDPFIGVSIPGGQITLVDEPGLGVRRRTA